MSGRARAAAACACAQRTHFWRSIACDGKLRRQSAASSVERMQARYGFKVVVISAGPARSPKEETALVSRGGGRGPKVWRPRSAPFYL